MKKHTQMWTRLAIAVVTFAMLSVTAWAQDQPAEQPAPEELDVLFVGDSITDFWDNAGMPVLQKYYGFRRFLNIGVSGDVTEVTLNQRLEQPRVANIAPKVIMLMIGTNDIGWKQLPPEEAIEGNRKILEKLRTKWPDAKILHLAVFPRSDREDAQAKIDTINAAISQMEDKEHIFFLDINKNFLGPDGKVSKDLFPDLLHPNAAGYELWAKAVEPTISGWLGGVAVQPQDRLDKEWWKERFEANKKDFQEREVGLVLLGDSITHQWDNRPEQYQQAFGAYSPANWGFGADRTEHVLWRLDNIGEGKVAPKAFMLLIGVNNIGHDSSTPDQTIEGIRAILLRIEEKWPNAKVLLLPVFPFQATNAEHYRQQVNRINQRISDLADYKRVFYLNFNDKFLTPDGTLTTDVMPDLLHPNAKGGQIWADAVQPALRALMAQ